MAAIEDYKMDNGYYDDNAIRRDAGMDDRDALFASIFADDTSEDPQPSAELEPEWQALLDEAKRRNDALHIAQCQANETEARALVQQPEPWSTAAWQRLHRLGYARRITDTGSERSYGSMTYELTQDGIRLIDPNWKTPGIYADQVED